MYGHREISLTYARSVHKELPQNLILEAGLQHGWIWESGIWKVRGKDLRQRPRYVWGSKWEDSLNQEVRNIAIGAPWLYLIAILRNRIEERRDLRPGRGIIFFPGHSLTSIHKPIHMQLNHFDAIAKNFSRKSIFLFWLDFCNPTVRETFESSGYQIHRAGFGSPRGELPQSNAGDRVAF